MNKQYCTVDN